MSKDFDDKKPVAPEETEDIISSETTPDEGQGSRRQFLTSLGKWSGAAIGLALLGTTVASAQENGEEDFEEGEFEGKPESSWRCWRCRCRCWRCRCRCRCRW